MAEVFRFDKIALQEALWEQQQVDIVRTRLPRESFHAREGGLDVAKNLWCLACAYSQVGSQCAGVILARPDAN